MATNRTAKFGLCLWEAEDKVLRANFNEDNEKIDEVLGEMNDCRLHLIREFVTTEAQNPLRIDLSDFDWSEWKTVHLDVIPGAGSSENMLFAYFGINSNVGTISPTWNHMTLCPYGQKDMPLSGIYFGKSSCLFHLYNIPFSMFKWVDLISRSGSDTMAAGTKVIIRGEKV